MSLTSSTHNILYSSHKAITNATTQLQPENIQCFNEARNLLARKKIIKGNIILKLRKKKMNPVPTLHYHKVCRKHLGTALKQMPTTNMITTCFPYKQDYNYPITINDWQQLQTPLYSVLPVPLIIPTTPLYPTHIAPVIGTVVQPILSPILPQTFIQDDVVNISNYTDEHYSTEHTKISSEASHEQSYYKENDSNTDIANTNIQDDEQQSDNIESYLKLPKELFPTPNMLALDPNPLIDEFCKMPNLQCHIPWILDLEFGIPKSPITRPIPTYNVKFNSIHCKNTPDAIHPGFESCDPDFKKVLLFYYDCIVSAWYRGYMMFHCDRSVDNFQSWLLLPMQVLGMCWP